MVSSQPRGFESRIKKGDDLYIYVLFSKIALGFWVNTSIALYFTAQVNLTICEATSIASGLPYSCILANRLKQIRTPAI